MPSLRFASTRGRSPFLDQHITDVYGEARCRAVGGSERAAADGRVDAGMFGLSSEVGTGRWGRTRRWSSSGLVIVRSDGGKQTSSLRPERRHGRTRGRPTEIYVPQSRAGADWRGVWARVWV